jgi:hypothetical protein
VCSQGKSHRSEGCRLGRSQGLFRDFLACPRGASGTFPCVRRDSAASQGKPRAGAGLELFSSSPPWAKLRALS